MKRFAGAWPLVPGLLVAAALDLVFAAGTHPLGMVRAFDLAALLALVATLLCHWRGDAAAWRTPLDGRLAGALAVLVCAAGPWPGAVAHPEVLRRGLAAGAVFYALMAHHHREPRARELAWAAFPLAAAGLGLVTLVGATAGRAALGTEIAVFGPRWGGTHALGYAQLVATVVTIGRACERASSRRWRLAAVVGSVGLALLWAGGGSPLDAASPARLEDPLAFSLTVVCALVLHGVARAAWAHRRECPAEAGRWTGVVLAGALLGTALLFGIGPVGEGAALLSAIGAALACGTPERAPAVPAARPGEPPAPALSRAA